MRQSSVSVLLNTTRQVGILNLQWLLFSTCFSTKGSDIGLNTLTRFAHKKRKKKRNNESNKAALTAAFFTYIADIITHDNKFIFVVDKLLFTEFTDKKKL